MDLSVDTANNRRSMLLNQTGLARTITMAAAKGLPVGSGAPNAQDRASKRYSVNALYSMAAEQDVEVDDELAQAQRDLRDLKAKISAQSKRNFVLERDVRYLDSRIALLIQNRMALHEQQEVASHLEETEHLEGTFPDDRKRQAYGNLFFLLQSEPRHIAHLTRLVSLSEIDTLLQTVMFTLYGNQYESREEHLLLTMFQGVLSAQFESATDFGSLLRANTPVSRMMTTYTRRGPGQSYLKSVLSARINEIIDSVDEDLEINPLQVYDALIRERQERGESVEDLPRAVSAEAAAEHPAVQAIIQPRVAKLVSLAEGFISTIIASREEVPYGIRWICKQIRSLTKRKYPGATDVSICSLIGGFFFLRFLNPAVVTPQAYMLVDGPPQRRPLRTLTLLAKVLQNLANKPTYGKEAYMFSLNPFVEANKARLNIFLNELCEVGDFYESLELDQYMALSKKEIILSITLNEIYNTHSLLLKHLGDLTRSPEDHLSVLLADLGPSPTLVSRPENKTMELPLFSRWEIPISDANVLTGENSLTQSDLLFMETKSIFVQLIRSMPSLAKKTTGLVLPTVAEMSATSKDATLVRKGIKVSEMLRELEDLGVIQRADNYKLLTEEVKHELQHLGSLREKVQEEHQSLRAVYQTICDHNNYLRSQLEDYKAYLQNVRVQSGGSAEKKSKAAVLGPYKFTHVVLEKDGVIVESNVPEARKPNIYFTVRSPLPGTFVIALHYKGRDKAILEMDLKLDDLLEKQQDGVQKLDLEYVQLNVSRLINLLNKTFNKR